MHSSQSNRRDFLRTSALGTAALLTAPYVATADAQAKDQSKSKNDRFRIGAIGMRYQGTVITDGALPWGDVVAICDVDRQIAEKAREHYGGKADLYEDYREMLDRKDIDAVTIGAPDHWHTAMAIAACKAGKHVYCEKPLTLTIDEGKLLCRVAQDSGVVFQVGTRLRSDHHHRLACETVHAGRLGKLKRIIVGLGTNPQGGPFKVQEPPTHLNWDLWLGQAPMVPYTKERCHYTFRWWYEYAGGKQADIGAHFLDLAQWAMGMQYSGPVKIDAKATFPNTSNGYNVASSYEVRMVYADGVEIVTGDHVPGGVRYDGELGWLHGTKGEINGKPFNLLKDDPIPQENYRLYRHDNPERPLATGKPGQTHRHMGNFFDCIRNGTPTLSDVLNQHRAASVCHLANISQRLGRKLNWDPENELFIGDEEADRHLRRAQRKGYEISG